MSEQVDTAVEAPQFTAARWTDALATLESNEFSARVAKHLREDLVVWLTTVSPSGLPSPNLVWFLWDGADTIRIFTTPEAARTRNIQKNTRVSLNFGGDSFGFDVVVLSGTAQIDAETPAANDFPEFINKYAEWFPRANQTPTSWSEYYRVPIVVTLSRVRGI
jgi:PPOX class probable F420-dependent enzyme